MGNKVQITNNPTISIIIKVIIITFLILSNLSMAFYLQ